jgi:tRNA-2-methylthio-N6-dimethylallyladenosine synthase
MKGLIPDTAQDESRQGEAIAASAGDTVFHKHFYLESYGCAMNFADSEVVASILRDKGYGASAVPENANVVLINTCSIREKAEETVRNRLKQFLPLKRRNPSLLIGILGCMAERLKTTLLEEEKLVDMVIGPDSYRSLPELIHEAESGQKAVNVLLSREETYADISPIRLNSNGVTAFVSIMRGCNNMCSFCVVPFTRGRERSRNPHSILKECRELFESGYREVTLLGQNVDSYYWMDEAKDEVVNFANLLRDVAGISPKLRIRFSTSHPKDITDDVLFAIRDFDNICNYIHLPVQSGSTRILQLMNRSYSREWYIAKVDRIREILPDCGISTDMIAGFCTETEEDHRQSLSLMDYCRYDLAYLYFYSERPGTLAARRMEDDVPLEVKKRRLDDLVVKFRESSLNSMQKDVGKTFRVLVEGVSKKNENEFFGRNDQNKVIVFPKEHYNKGDYVDVHVIRCTSGTLIGKAVAFSSIN